MTHFGKYDLLTILGPTASGKTRVATHLALHYNAEIISGDSRQVYRGMNLGTGKDLSEYDIDGHHVPYHLIDIANPGEKYNIYRFQQDFVEALHTIRQHDRQTILCGGSGLYLPKEIEAELIKTKYREYYEEQRQKICHLLENPRKV